MVIVNIGGLPSYSLLMRNTLTTFSYEQRSATYAVFGDGHALPELIFTTMLRNEIISCLPYNSTYPQD